MKAIPCCFFPTKVFLIDDNRSYLESILINLSGESSVFEIYDQPKEGLEVINDHGGGGVQFPDNLIKKEESFEFGGKKINIDLAGMYCEVYNRERFDRISTIVVDYSMPGMNGLEFCKGVKDPRIKKIMLTGEADQRIAIDAFNAGLIDMFIEKQDPELTTKLNEGIRACQEAYFSDVSEFILSAVGEQYALTDPAVVEVFEKAVRDAGAVEYYLIEDPGSFLFIDRKGKAGGFFLRNKDQVEAIRLEAESEESLSEKDRGDISSIKKILCYHRMGGAPYPDLSEWGEYLGDAKKFEGKEAYYWAVSKNISSVDEREVLSFDVFKER